MPENNLKCSRQEIISQINSTDCFDLIVIGGGIQGASLARAAAHNNISVLLVEKNDYGAATSTRTSKLAHGGIRYLEFFDFKQVFEGIKARELLFKNASDFVYPFEMLFPIASSDKIGKVKYAFGLWLYHLFANKEHKKFKYYESSQISDLEIKVLGEKISGAYKFIDGQMDDAGLVLANIRSAREKGALCLNYFEAKKFSNKSSFTEVEIEDLICNETLNVRAKCIANCCGPWVAETAAKLDVSLPVNIKYSQGAHLLFTKKWNSPGLVLPLKESKRYYFVLPHPAGTLVGTTEFEVNDVKQDPLPSREKILEILLRLKRDLPESGLDKTNLHYCYAGIRTLAVSKNGNQTKLSQVSRRPRWYLNKNVLSLVGGKYTTAALTAERGIELIAKVLDLILPLKNVSTETFKAIPKEPITEEFRTAIDYDQAETIEDVLRRRTRQEYHPGSGLDKIPELLKIMQSKLSETTVIKQAEGYKARIDKIQQLINSI